ncbi:MAG: hypothetical protein PHQ23_06395 [Candidatus Wallbacteria bacterium]|nr:hypothetical protein [Candidatus Wallbacteria bacterium]
MKYPLLSALFLLLAFSAALPVHSATSIMGPTGVINSPSPETLEKGFLESGLHFRRYTFGSFNGSGSQYSFKANFGVAQNCEAGFEKTLDTGSYLEDPGITVNGKIAYTLGENLSFAAGVLLDSDTNDYSSAYFVFGAPVAFFGFGFNFGGHQNTFNHAQFGGYDFEDGQPDQAFFLAGAEFKVNQAAFTIGYNGDYVSMGIRAPLESEQMTVDVGWTSESDYVDYFRQVKNPNYDQHRYIVGLSATF